MNVDVVDGVTSDQGRNIESKNIVGVTIGWPGESVEAPDSDGPWDLGSGAGAEENDCCLRGSDGPEVAAVVDVSAARNQ